MRVFAQVQIARVIALHANDLRYDKAQAWIDILRLVAELAHVYDGQEVLFQLDQLVRDVLVQ
jgi:hypothetical protein